MNAAIVGAGEATVPQPLAPAVHEVASPAPPAALSYSGEPAGWLLYSQEVPSPAVPRASVPGQPYSGAAGADIPAGPRNAADAAGGQPPAQSAPLAPGGAGQPPSAEGVRSPAPGTRAPQANTPPASRQQSTTADGEAIYTASLQASPHATAPSPAPAQKLVQKGYYITEEQHKRLGIFAVLQGSDRSAIVRAALESYFAANEDKLS